MKNLEEKFKDEAWELLLQIGKNDPKGALYSVIPMTVAQARKVYGDFKDKMIDPKIPDDEICFIAYLMDYAGEDFKLIRETKKGKKVFYFTP